MFKAKSSILSRIFNLNRLFLFKIIKMPACLSKFKKEITIEEMKKVNEKLQKQTEEMKLEIEQMKLKNEQMELKIEKIILENEEIKLENEELDRFLLIEDMKWAFGEIDHLVKEDQKLFEYYNEELRCFEEETLTRVYEQYCKDSWVEITMIDYEMVEGIITRHGTTIFEYKSKCPKKCPGYYHHLDCLRHMSGIHGIKTRSDGGNKGCSYEPIRVLCMKKDTFEIMTCRTKKFFGIKNTQ